MKKILMIIVGMMTCITMFPSVKTPAQQLIKRLQEIQKNGVMIGHQDDPLYGTTWKWEKNRSDVKDVCGDYPAVMGFELGALELDKEKSIDGVPFNLIREEIVAQYERGGISTLSWHPHNPVTNGNAWDTEGTPLKEILNNGSQSKKFDLWLDKIIDFIQSLKTSNGEKIPVIFRPWHEMSGGWFWWGIKSCNSDEYKQLFRYTIDRMRAQGVNNAVICYSPGATSDDTEEKFMRFYPGDNYVDLLGVDAYQYGTNEQYIKDVRNELKVMHNIGKQRKKLYALTETGYRNTPDANWFTETILPTIQGFKMSYVLFWRNAWDQKEENFGPAPEKACAADFVKFHQCKHTLFVKDINK